MGAGSARYGVAVLILVVLWIAVYWWTPAPAPTPVVSFGDTPSSRPAPAATAPSTSQPITPPVVFEAPPQAEPESPAPEPERSAVIPPSFRDYTVRPGDTAESISRRFYGTPQHWQQVMKANPRVDFMRLKAGRVIRIPVDPNNIQGLPAEVDSPPPAPPPAMLEYRVKSGDTLSDIAREIYGRAAMWTIIRDANRDKVGADGSRIRPGMVLLIPPAPSGASN